MVYYFTIIDPSYTVYMGKDANENDELIKYAWPEDLWFHVDNYSSAHVYIRLKPGDDPKTLPANVIEDLTQLVKENSIEGKKLSNVKVVYTMAPNLKKSGDMNAGQVGFHDQKAVMHVNVAKRNREIINRLNKTKREEFPDLKKLLDERMRQERETKKKQEKERAANEKKEQERRQAEKEAKSYDSFFASATTTSKKKSGGDLDDVFGDGADYDDGFNDMDDFI